MKARTRSVFAAMAVLLWASSAHAQARATVPIAIETTLGTIEAVLDSAHAPITTVNILRYIDAQAYDSATFFRAVRLDNQPADSVRIEVIQLSVARGRGRGIPPIPLERTSVTGLKHEDGVLSMARSGPDTGTSSFSIVINAQPQMDFGGKRQPDGQGFAVFGRVTRGMDIVRRIQNLPVQAQRLEPPVTILRIVRR